MRKSRLILLLVLLSSPGLLPAQPVPAFEVPGRSAPTVRTRAQIQARLDALALQESGAPYTVPPRFRGQHVAGELSPAFVNAGLAWLNLHRYVAGLPDDVAVSPAWSSLAQHAAVLMQVLGTLSHDPPQPSGMARVFYDKAHEGAATSNLHQGQGDLKSAVSGWIHDSDDSNIDRVGHRRWILAPDLSQVGFGYADEYAALKVFGDGDAARTTGLTYVAWPPAGPMPLSLFSADTAWSFSIDPTLVAPGAAAGARVEVTRTRDGKTWRFGGGPSDGYLNVETSGFGLGLCVIFRPASLTAIRDGDVFEVRITGIRSAAGGDFPIRYETRFFNPGPEIKVTVASRRPAVQTVEFTWETARYGRKTGKSTDGSMNFGFVGVPISGFSFVVDTPEGVLPLGVEINGTGLVHGPGEWVAAPPGGIHTLRLVSGASGGLVTYNVYRQAKGWSPWAEAGKATGFGEGEPIEVINVFFR